MFTKYLQDAFDAVVVIQLTNDEKFLFSKELKRPLEEFTRLGRENAKVRWLLSVERRVWAVVSSPADRRRTRHAPAADVCGLGC